MTGPAMGSSSPEEAEDTTAKRVAEEASSRGELHRAIVLIQHQLNNPLAALLAETQLLGLEPGLDAEQRAAAVRITELTRRVIALVHDLDQIVDSPTIAGDKETDPALAAGDGRG